MDTVMLDRHSIHTFQLVVVALDNVCENPLNHPCHPDIALKHFTDFFTS